MARYRLALLLAVCASAAAQDTPAWPDTYVARLQALALVETLHADLLATRSSTLTLEAWCRDHRLAKDAAIVADSLKGAAKAATAEQRARLQAGPSDEVRYRSVRLRCGERVLAEADNWYLPSRLTAQMNRLLDTTDTPFGKAVAALQPYRQTFASRMLWSPLPEGWELRAAPKNAGGTLAIPDALFEHQAVLYTREHVPFSEVDEVYERPLLAFPPPK